MASGITDSPCLRQFDHAGIGVPYPHITKTVQKRVMEMILHGGYPVRDSHFTSVGC